MGRDFYFVVVQKNKEHNINKVCLSVDYEPDRDVKDNILLNKFSDCKTFYDIKSEHWCQICDTCAWFLDPVKAYVDKEYSEKEDICNDNVVDTYHIRHSYDLSPSDYYFYHIISHNSSNTSHVYLQDGGGVYEIDSSDVEYSMEKLSEMSIPKRKTDIQAREQTKDLLDWMEQYCNDEGLQVLFFNE